MEGAAPAAPLVPRLLLGLSLGGGGMSVPCDACGDWRPGGAALGEFQAGAELSPRVTVFLGFGFAMSDGDPWGTVEWVALSTRISTKSRFFIEPRLAFVQTTVETTLPCDDFGCALATILTAGLYLPTDTLSEEAGVALQIGAGYELPVGRGWSLVPQLHAMVGHASISGLSLGVQRVWGTGARAREGSPAPVAWR